MPAAAHAHAHATGADSPLERVVARVLQADDVPAFSKAMQDLMAAIGREDSSAQRLANVVVRDYALTTKVLRVANAAHYNRGGRPVQSATHALMLLGARTVRDLASALLLFEHYRHRSPGLRELMLLSLLTASTARAAAERCGAAVDADAAHLAGMFRNLGEVMAAAHLPDVYGAALMAVPTHASPVQAATAARGAMGCSFDDLGLAVARHWGLPEGVRHGMRADGAADADLGAVCTAFAHDLTTAVHRSQAALAADDVTRILARYGTRLRLTRDAVAQLADRAVADTREIFAAAGVRLDDLRLSQQVAAALGRTDRNADRNADRSADRSADQDTAGPDHPSDAPDADDRPGPAPDAAPTVADTRARLAPEFAAAAADVAGYDVAGVLLFALEAVLRGGPFDRACFRAADPAAREFRPRTGLGDGIDKLLDGPGVPFGADQGPTGPALLDGREVQLAHGVRLTHAESQLLRRWEAVSVALVPVSVDGVVIGCVHADRRTAYTAYTAPAAAGMGWVREIVRTLERAIAARRFPGLPPSAAPPPEVVADVAVPTALKMDAVLRLLRGEALDVVAAAADVSADVLVTWRAEFLAGAAARLGAG